jgi:serine protease Do
MKRLIEMSWAIGVLGFALTLSALAQPQEKVSTEPLQALNASLAQLTARVSPAVVHIRVTSFRSSGDEHEGDEKSQTFTKQRGAGSGVIVDPEGYIVTALHLVEGERRIRVELDKGFIRKASIGHEEGYKLRSSYEARIVGSFKDADLAVLKIDARDLPTLSFSEPGNLKQGQLVAALGNPEGLRNSLSLGVVSSVAQQIEPDDFMAYIQTDAALAPGSSGGPLVDVQGGVVGINVFSVTDRGKDEGLGFAVPSAMARFVYEQIRQYGCVPRANLGMDVQGITPTLASALDLPTESGVIVAGLDPGSPAAKASVQAGDVILSFAGMPIESLPQLNWALLHKRAGQHVVLEIARKSSKKVLSLTLIGEAPDSADGLAATDIEENSLAKLGVVGSALKHGVMGPHSKESPSGVLVTAKLSGTDTQPELIVGDVIRSVNGVSVISVAPLRTMLEGFKPGDAIALQVERNGKLMYVAFEMD